MAKTCKVTVNNETFVANCGDLLLDGAMMNGVDLPHDCRSGSCGTCRVRLVEGKVFGGDDAGSDMIHACQARIVSDLKIVTEPVPDPVSVPAQIVHMTRLAPDVIGVSIEVEKPLEYLPGQYCNVQFRGHPGRCYSPTYPLVGGPNPRVLHFHIRTLPDGAVSSALGKSIRIGHRVRLSGPHGSAFLRPKHPGGTVLVSGGTGFAPIWRRFTCMARCAGWRCFPMSRSCLLSPSRRAFRRRFAADCRPSICRICRRTTSSTPPARRG
jgi:3-phenylpropionate/trans-cinnamate dioxygenase ferredoxin reductase subunit